MPWHTCLPLNWQPSAHIHTHGGLHSYSWKRDREKKGAHTFVGNCLWNEMNYEWHEGEYHKKWTPLICDDLKSQVETYVATSKPANKNYWKMECHTVKFRQQRKNRSTKKNMKNNAANMLNSFETSLLAYMLLMGVPLMCMVAQMFDIINWFVAEYFSKSFKTLENSMMFESVQFMHTDYELRIVHRRWRTIYGQWVTLTSYNNIIICNNRSPYTDLMSNDCCCCCSSAKKKIDEKKKKNYTE